jgi:predicted RNA-binding Zn ribbon-like protein
MKDMKATVKPSTFQFISGNLALDFVNTVGDRLASASRKEHFLSSKDLAVWIKLAGLHAGHRRAVRLQDAIALREALYRIFEAAFRSEAPRKGDLLLLNDVVGRSRSSWKLEAVNRNLQWQWMDPGKIPYPLGQIAESAVQLLLSNEIQLLRQCGDEYCGWLFLDRSQGRRRKWCSMRDCGNRAKVRRFFRKKRKLSRSPK